MVLNQAVTPVLNQTVIATKNAQSVGQVNTLLQQATAAQWQGLSANAYNTANAACAALAQAITHSDRTMESLVQNQAECVTQTQLGLGVAQDALIPTYATALHLEKTPATFNMALVLAVAAVSSALITAVGLLINCAIESDSAASAAHKVDYHGIASTAQRLITDALPAASGRTPRSGTRPS